ncbi:fumarylacetoacetate hydrolase family protein [Noviherbaspirillum sp. Root189]|uniref:fumarylacetoacetate hydrolase family protein n=1 Tax=Noviherbaspirillum sp. Root189 TaxID=1736487 RepID=UPI00070CA139|nr:fumarylacetoacetate hydrolase family protein [Noviherbaspirillum sp. Root189]KRB72959.1 2-keto-4-pentenoate hydratase [Noviherbaspirillum sp. Root189]
MKLATLKNGRRDGQLLVVSRDLRTAVAVPDIASTMQQALEEWPTKHRALDEVYRALNAGIATEAFALDVARLAAPLPRAYQWADGSAYLVHSELVRKARGAELTPELWQDPLMYQGCGDSLLGARDDVALESTNWGIDLEGEVAVFTDDVPMGVSPQQAKGHIRLIALVNDVSLRGLVPSELAKGFGFFQSKPWTAFSPVAVTPDELGDAWDGQRVHLPLTVHVNDDLLGRPDAGVDMVFDFPQLIAHAAKTRPLGAGTIIGSGTVSNGDRSVGSACLAEKRALETVRDGKPCTPFLKFGDRMTIDMFDRNGNSIFGAISQRVVAYAPPLPV